MAPDKIYVGVKDLGSGYATDVSLSPGDGYPEYIRKDALLEWIDEYKNYSSGPSWGLLKTHIETL